MTILPYMVSLQGTEHRAQTKGDACARMQQNMCWPGTLDLEHAYMRTR